MKVWKETSTKSLNSTSYEDERKLLSKKVMRIRPKNSIHPNTAPSDVIIKCKNSAVPKKLHCFSIDKDSSTINWEEVKHFESIIKEAKTYKAIVRIRGQSNEKMESFILQGSDNTTEFFLRKVTGVNIDVTYRSAPQG